MNSTKFYKISAICLLVINLILIGFMIFAPPPPHKKGGPKHFIIKKLNFDKQQINQFEVLIGKHKKSRKEIHNKIIAEKKTLYQLLLKENKNIERDSVISLIGGLQQKAESIDFKHFDDLRSICSEAQKKKFEELILELAELFTPKKRPGKK
jgi:periplasmic protein CpxP/Spy